MRAEPTRVVLAVSRPPTRRTVAVHAPPRQARTGFAVIVVEAPRRFAEVAGATVRRAMA